ncbi:MAG TPA: hypothetical protein DCY94_03135 [Firmicutes bacterium]|nr:hypothetical protein [Bacillota bacterium]
MKILNKLTLANLRLNKKRAIGTTIGIILSVALITATGGLFTSFRSTLVENTVEETGYYHINLENISQKKYDEVERHKNVDHITKIYMLGWANFESIRKESSPYIKIFSIDRESFDNHRFEISEGRFPIDDDEILMSKKALEDASLKVGDTLELDVGIRMSSDGFPLKESNPYNKDYDEEHIENATHKTYKIVGIAERSYWNNSYFALTTKEKSDDIKAYIALKNPKDYNKTFDELTLDAKTSTYSAGKNSELLRWEIFAFSDSTITMLYTICGIIIVIIMTTSIFCIRNSFAISTLEKMKMYGMLASIGATKRQIKKSVTEEGMMLGLIGIPLGILGGTFAVVVLVKIVNLLIGSELFGTEHGMVLKMSMTSIILAIILGLVVIYFSSISSARKASKVSPIENLRSSNEIKITSKKLKTPKLISKVFKTGGVLAYKNLKRSKKKYKTTVISLTVSIFVFISMNAFINEAIGRSTDYYRDYPYNIGITENSNKPLTKDEITAIRNMEDADKSYILYEAKHMLTIEDLSHVIINEGEEREYTNGVGLLPVALDDETFKLYAKNIGANYEDIKDKGIIYNKIRFYNEEKNKTIEGKRYTYKNGDRVTAIKDYDSKEKYTFTVGTMTMEPPYGLETNFYSGGYVVFDEKYATDLNLKLSAILIESSNPNKLEDALLKLNSTLYISNIAEEVRVQRSFALVISIFLYGFITVITLIGVTNIFNTITANMELRSKEFAILKSIGMTKHEFNRMVNLETIFYSTKSLLYGTILGLIGAYAVHLAFQEKMETSFQIPYNAILIAVIFVLLIVFMIMRYSIAKINRQNTIETIRNENI